MPQGVAFYATLLEQKSKKQQQERSPMCQRYCLS